MIEAVGDLWAWAPSCPHTEHTVDVCVAARRVDARCITTNSVVNSQGRAVMGRGVALQAAQRYPKLPKWFGEQLQAHGNVPLNLGRLRKEDGSWLVSFPVKRDWREKANLQLIRYSARLLVEMADTWSWKTVVLPRPGCGNGGRDWYREVAPIVTRILDDRFVVVAR